MQQSHRLFLAHTLLLCFRLAASAYDEESARRFAKLSAAAYCSGRGLEDWTCGPCKDVPVKNVQVCSSGESNIHAFIGDLEGNCIVGFEGTNSWESYFTDANFLLHKPQREWAHCEGCTLHSGFYDTWKELKPCIHESLASLGCGSRNNSSKPDSQRKVDFTGHSLGAALTAIAMMSMEMDGYMIGQAYNFGMPRTGNAAFSKDFTDHFAGRFNRVTHHKDAIIQVPPPFKMLNKPVFKHVGHEVYYDGNISSGYTLCADAEDPHCAFRYHTLLPNQLSIADHMHYMDLIFGIAQCPSESPSDQVESMILV